MGDTIAIVDSICRMLEQERERDDEDAQLWAVLLCLMIMNLIQFLQLLTLNKKLFELYHANNLILFHAYLTVKYSNKFTLHTARGLNN